MRAASAVVGILVAIVGIVGGTCGASIAAPHLVLEGGLVSSLLPFGADLFLGVGYESDEFAASSTTTVSALPTFAAYEQASLSFSPRGIEIGLDLGLSVVPFGFDVANVWASAPFIDADIGGESPVYLRADAIGRLWLADPFGGDVSVDFEVEIPGELTTLTLLSTTSITYDAIAGLGAEEALEASIAFDRPRFFSGHLLTEDDLTTLIVWARVGLRVDESGLFTPGVLLGLRLRVESPLPQDVEE